MQRHKATGTFTVTGIGTSCRDLDGQTIALSGEIRVDGFIRQATVAVNIPNALAGVLVNALNHPVEQIPMFRPELIRLSILKV